MEFDPPVKHKDNSYSVPIRSLEPYVFTVTSGTTPATDSMELKEASNVIANEYEPYSSKWFGAKTLPVVFLKRLSHSWDLGTHSPAQGPVRQSWCPDHIRLLPTTNRIHWKLESIESGQKPSGPIELDTNNIPLQPVNEVVTIQSSPRSKAIRKVRMARLHAAVIQARAARLTKRFYERYGSLEPLEGEECLSSESENEKDSNAFRIKI